LVLEQVVVQHVAAASLAHAAIGDRSRHAARADRDHDAHRLSFGLAAEVELSSARLRDTRLGVIDAECHPRGAVDGAGDAATAGTATAALAAATFTLRKRLQPHLGKEQPAGEADDNG